MDMQLLYIFNLFSFVGVIGLLFYLVLERAKRLEKESKYDRQSDKLDRLERHIYELEEKLAKSTPAISKDEVKDQIITMYNEGKDLMFIEKALDVSRAKIEMVLKFHKLREKREK
jgi:transposase-like protein